MAIESLKSDLSAIFRDRNAYTAIANALIGGNAYRGVTGYKIHTVEVFIEETAQKVRAATIQAIRQALRGPVPAAQYVKMYKSQFHIDNFILAVNNVINRFNIGVPMYGNKGSRFRRASRGFGSVVRDSLRGPALFVIQPVGGAGGMVDYRDFLRAFRDACFKEWKRIVGRPSRGRNPSHRRKTLPRARIDQPGSFRRQKQYGEGVHDPISVYLAWIELKAHEIQAEISATIEELDLVQEILDAINVVWNEDTNYKSGALGQKRVFTLSLGPENVSLLFDKAGIPDIIDALTNLQYGLLYTKGFPYLSPEKAFEAVASPTFRQQAAAAAQYKIIRDLMTKNKRHLVRAKIKTRKPSTKPRSATLKTGKRRTRGRRTRVTLPQRVRVQQVVEKGQGQEASTDIAADLSRLTKYINSRLSAEVRRNMGRPALRNITGRFSNSVQLESLTQAKATIMAKYTYLLSPYQTFENTGRRRWPMAYNPKLLIAKSIRNLAQGRIEQKLTVRRV